VQGNLSGNRLETVINREPTGKHEQHEETCLETVWKLEAVWQHEQKQRNCLETVCEHEQ
jgi:hypothetical protein